MRDVEILLVEDNPKDTEPTLYALRRHNLANRVHVARDGREAIDFFFGPDARGQKARPHLIHLDLKLPRVDGREVLRRLKEHPRTRSIPVVVLTSSDMESDLKRCYDPGVNGYLRKPVDFQSFVKATKTIGLYWLLMNKTPEAP